MSSVRRACLVVSLVGWGAVALPSCGDAPGGGKDRNLHGEDPDETSDPTTPNIDTDTGTVASTPIDPTVLPSDRVISWAGRVGVDGGIPERPTERDCIAQDGVPTDGTSDAGPAIRDCLANTPAGQAAFLAAGTYRIRSGIVYDTVGIAIPSGVTLRGAGQNSTVLSAERPLDTIVYLGDGYSEGPLVSITAGFERGSSSLVLEDASALEVGDLLLINELNDEDLPVTAVSGWGDGSCDWCDQFGATRLRAQVVEVTGLSGDTVDISPQQLYHELSGERDPRAMRITHVGRDAGLERLTVFNGEGATDGWRTNIKIEGAANSWVEDVRVERCGKRCIDLRTYFYRLEIRGSTLTGCIDHESSDACYGTQIAEGSNTLVENNVYDDTSNGPLVMWGASGNVIAYNYIHGVYRTEDQDSWFWPNSWTHGAHTSFNLWEGNDFSGLNWDTYWGSSSHNTAFRNRIDGNNAPQGLVPGHIETAAIIVETNNSAVSIVGNVLGTEGWSDTYEVGSAPYWSENAIYATGINGDNVSGTLYRHHNFDYVTHSTPACDDEGEAGCYDADPSVPLPASLYLTAKPSWFGDVPWPPIDPDGPTVADLPAKVRSESQ